jgi:hypothetical protein
MFANEVISKGMVKWASKLPKESMLEVKANVSKVEKATACT